MTYTEGGYLRILMSCGSSLDKRCERGDIMEVVRISSPNFTAKDINGQLWCFHPDLEGKYHEPVNGLDFVDKWIDKVRSTP